MHKTGLDIGADENAEPDQVNAKFISRGRQHRDNDEGDFKEIQEEGDNEYEDVDENREANASAGQGRQHVFNPDLATDALKHEAEYACTDQDVDHHCGDA